MLPRYFMLTTLSGLISFKSLVLFWKFFCLCILYSLFNSCYWVPTVYIFPSLGDRGVNKAQPLSSSSLYLVQLQILECSLYIDSNSTLTYNNRLSF